MKPKFEYWFGDDGSQDGYHQALLHSANPEMLSKAGRGDDEEGSHLLSHYGATAVVSIKGSLLPFSNWVTRWLGLTTYPDIRNALVSAYEDDRVQQILLDIDSPGGAANGLEDISNLIAKIDKPIIAYSSGTMASAAYWIGASADQVFASRLSNVGSIGVIATHFDLTKSLENEGVKATVFRSGEFKALGGPYEELTPKAKQVIQAKLDTLYEEFVAHVARSRNVSTKTVHDKMADGREFLGYQALETGLIDGVMSIDDMMEKFTKKQSNGRTTTSTRMEASDMKKKLLTQEAIAVMEAGGSVDEALETAPEAPAEEAPGTETPAVETPATDVGAETQTPTAEASGSLVDYLKESLASTNEKLMQASIENKEMKSKLDAMEATHAQMREIVMDLTNSRQIALGGSSADLSMLTDEALLQTHNSVTNSFRERFPVGGRAQLPSTDAQTTASGAAVQMQARVKAVRA